jgi:hypothetical protein
MKWRRVMACGVIVVACFGALMAQATDGLVLKVSLDKAVYEPGEAITLSLEAHNEGAQRIDILHSEASYRLFLDGRLYRFDFEQNQPLSAKVTRSGRADAARRSLMIDSSRLEPGQAPLTMTLPVSGEYWVTGPRRDPLVVRPGDHVVRVVTAPMLMQPMPQQGLVMRRPMPAMPSAVSEPTFFKVDGDADVMQSLYYGRAVFEDGSPAVVPALSLKPLICMGSEEGGIAAHMAEVGDDGTFVMALTPQEVQQINQGALSLGAVFAPSARRVSLLSKESSLIALGSLGQSYSEPGVVKVARPPVYYGRILYEDGTVPATPTGRSAMFGVSVGAPMVMRARGSMGLDEAGYFAMCITTEDMERMTSQDRPYPIFNGPPTPDSKGRRIRKPVGKFPLALLSLDKAKAGVVKIPKSGAGG